MRKRTSRSLSAGAVAFLLSFIVVFTAMPASAAPTIIAVNLGDSFASGVGATIRPGQLIENLSRYEVGTNTSTNKCLRSSKSAAVLMAAQRGYTLRNVACSGAVTNELLVTGQFNEPAQINAVTPDTSIVTVTIGGNDIGFVGLVTCVVATNCNDASPEVVASRASLTTLAPKIDLVLSEITSRAPQAQVRIIGYPQVVRDSMNHGAGCFPWLAASEQRLANDIERTLNGIIKQSALSAGANVQYVDTYNAPVFALDDACSLLPDRKINGLMADIPNVVSPATLHPNEIGHEAIRNLTSATL